MALYLGRNKQKIRLDGNTLRLTVFSKTPITNGIRLLSSEGYALKDSNNSYLTILSETLNLTTKEDE